MIRANSNALMIIFSVGILLMAISFILSIGIFGFVLKDG